MPADNEQREFTRVTASTEGRVRAETKSISGLKRQECHAGGAQ